MRIVHMDERRPAAIWLLALLAWTACPPAVVRATIIDGVEYTNFLVIESTELEDFLLGTSEDIYVFAPDPIYADNMELHSGAGISNFQTIFTDTLLFSANELDPCAPCTSPYNRDVVVALEQPVGDFTLYAGGGIVIGTSMIPEPSTTLLFVCGLAVFAESLPARMKRRRRDLLSV
jgi:hypothetical protein